MSRIAVNKSYLIAAGLALALALWLLSGRLGDVDPQAAPPPATSPLGAETGGVTVQVREQWAQPTVRELVLRGQTEPNRQLTVRAEIAGKVSELVTRRGQRVAVGDVLLRLAADDRPARLSKARALLSQREGEYQAAQKMGERGYQSASLVDQALAQLEQAKAEVAQAELDLERTTVRAPFAGVLNERMVELGDVVDRNAALFHIVDNDPLRVTAQLPQQHLGQVEHGGRGEIKLITGEQRQGVVGYISATADPATRTFPLELTVANPDSTLAAGLSAEIRLPIETVPTHYLSPALLTLDQAGRLGVNTIDSYATVVFNPVEIVRTSADGVWVAGLPERAQIITAGQGFVRAGERVEVVREAPSANIEPQLEPRERGYAPAPPDKAALTARAATAH